jgi:hypothetical protein
MPFWTAEQQPNQYFRVMIPIVKAIPGGPRRLERLRTLSEAKLAEMRKTVDLSQSKGLPSARELVVTEAGQNYMTQIRAEINDFIRESYGRAVARGLERARIGRGPGTRGPASRARRRSFDRAGNRLTGRRPAAARGARKSFRQRLEIHSRPNASPA